MKNAYIASRPAAIAPREGLSSDAALSEAGFNTGNLLFFSAVRRVVKHASPSFSMSFKPAEVREKHDGIVIPAANWLNSTSDFGGLANLIEASRLPCVIVGLGAQSYSTSRVPKLTDGTLRFVRVLSDRAKSISVRGAFTAEVLASYGVRNVEVTGCPSLLWHVTRPAKIDMSLLETGKVALNGTRSDNDPALLKPDSVYTISLLISRYAIRNQLDYVLQTERSELRVLWGEDALLSKEDQSRLKKIYQIDDYKQIQEYVKNHAKLFIDVESWVDFLSTREFTAGTRLHGAIAALLGGRPALLISHDTRTQEMADEASIPTVASSAILQAGDLNLDDLRRHVDVHRFNDRSIYYFRRFRDFFAKNDVENNLAEI